MRARNLAIALAILSQPAMADIAKHTTVTVDQAGNPREFTEMVADDNGNLRMEMYSVAADGSRGSLKDLIVFQATENQMLSFSNGRCEAMSFEGDELPGGISRDEMMAAQQEMQQALEEMRATNPEMAKMMESRMAGMPGMSAMMGNEPEPVRIVETGEEKDIGDYDTIGFRIEGMPGGGNNTVWATDIDDVEGGRTMSAASRGMMQASKQMMENMGMGQMFGANVFGEVMEAMEDYYPIVSEDARGETRLLSTDGNGSEDFYPECN